MSTAKTKTIADFPTPESLYTYLKTHIPHDSLTSWGKTPGTKTIHNLWLELSEGETTLLDTSPPVRSLHVLLLRIFSPNCPSKTLLESHQLRSDGSLRTRNRPLSEKLKAGEEQDLVSAASRAVREEIGKGKVDVVVRLMSDTYVKEVEEIDSFSYPGLPGCYTMHTFDAVVDGLPDDVDEFFTEEGGEVGETEAAITVRKHFWKWVPVAAGDNGGKDDA